MFCDVRIVAVVVAELDVAAVAAVAEVVAAPVAVVAVAARIVEAVAVVAVVAVERMVVAAAAAAAAVTQEDNSGKLRSDCSSLQRGKKNAQIENLFSISQFISNILSFQHSRSIFNKYRLRYRTLTLLRHSAFLNDRHVFPGHGSGQRIYDEIFVQRKAENTKG